MHLNFELYDSFLLIRQYLLSSNSELEVNARIGKKIKCEVFQIKLEVCQKTPQKCYLQSNSCLYSGYSHT